MTNTKFCHLTAAEPPRPTAHRQVPKLGVPGPQLFVHLHAHRGLLHREAEGHCLVSVPERQPHGVPCGGGGTVAGGTVEENGA